MVKVGSDDGRRTAMSRGGSRKMGRGARRIRSERGERREV